MANANVDFDGAAGALAFDDPNIWDPDPNNDPNNWVNPNLAEPGANFQLIDLLNAGGQGAGGQGAGGHAAGGGGPLAAREPPAADRKHD